MSGLVRTATPSLPGHRHWQALIAALATVAVAVVLVIAFSGGGNSSSSSVSPITSSPTSGPNETARGNAAATASGAQTLPGGPNEDARGQAVSSASR